MSFFESKLFANSLNPVSQISNQSRTIPGTELSFKDQNRQPEPLAPLKNSSNTTLTQSNEKSETEEHINPELYKSTEVEPDCRVENQSSENYVGYKLLNPSLNCDPRFERSGSSCQIKLKALNQTKLEQYCHHIKDGYLGFSFSNVGDKDCPLPFEIRENGIDINFCIISRIIFKKN